MQGHVQGEIRQVRAILKKKCGPIDRKEIWSL